MEEEIVMVSELAVVMEEEEEDNLTLVALNL
jgi:hypothetical protein